MKKSSFYFKIAIILSTPIILNLLTQILQTVSLVLTVMFIVAGILLRLSEIGIFQKIQKTKILFDIRKTQLKLYGSLIIIFPCLLFVHYTNDLRLTAYIMISNLILMLFVFLQDIPKLRALHSQYNRISSI